MADGVVRLRKYTEINTFSPKVQVMQGTAVVTIDDLETEDTTNFLPRYSSTATCDPEPTSQSTIDEEALESGHCNSLQSPRATEPEFINALQSNQLLAEPT